VTVVQYVAQLADEGMTLAAIRRVLELEEQVKALEIEREALLRSLAERDRLIAGLVQSSRSSQPSQASQPSQPPQPSRPDRTPGRP